MACNDAPTLIRFRGRRAWLWPDGHLLPVVAGGADDDPSGDGGSGGDDGGAGDSSGDGEPSGEPEDKTDWRAMARRWERDAKKAREQLKSAQDAARQATLSEHEKAIEKARQEAEAAGRNDERSKAVRRILVAEVRAAAGGRMADPADAVRLIDIDDFVVDDDGEPDPKQISAAIDALLKAKPYLAAKPNGSSDDDGQTMRRSFPDLGQGRRQGTPKPSIQSGAELYAARAGKKN